MNVGHYDFIRRELQCVSVDQLERFVCRHETDRLSQSQARDLYPHCRNWRGLFVPGVYTIAIIRALSDEIVASFDRSPSIHAPQRRSHHNGHVHIDQVLILNPSPRYWTFQLTRKNLEHWAVQLA